MGNVRPASRNQPSRSRRQLVCGIATLALAVAVLGASNAAPQTEGKRMAITIDDLPTASVLGNDIERAERTTRDLLAAMRRADVPAIGFVNEGKLQPSGVVEPRRVALLQQWIDAGFDLGNHTFSHSDLHRIDVATFERDIARGDVVTRKLLAKVNRTPHYFRHPFLHTGRSREVRDRIVAFLASRGYAVAPITLDNYDYIFAAAYDRAADAGTADRARKIETTYLDYMNDVVSYYEQQSQIIVGRPIAHTLLLHASALNAATIGRLIERLGSRGYRFITLDEALKDPAYASTDEYVGPAGLTWLHRWALTQGKRGIFAGEPEVPEWIRTAAER